MNILIVDDHPMSVSGYTDTLSSSGLFPKSPSFFKAYNCEEAFYKIMSNTVLDLAIIDFSLPPFAGHHLFSGSDLAKIIKQNHPDCKIIIVTAHTEILIVYDIYKKTNPDGLIIKNDLNSEYLKNFVVEVLNGNHCKSCTVKKVIKDINRKELMVDDTNRAILMYLSQGNKIKDIEGMTNLSISAIQRRIAQMKDAFDVSEESNLLKEAILQGFL